MLCVLPESCLKDFSIMRPGSVPLKMIWMGFTSVFAVGYYIKRKPLADGRFGGPVHCLTERCINATKFQKALRNSLAEYISELKQKDLDSEVWVLSHKKLLPIFNHSEYLS